MSCGQFSAKRRALSFREHFARQWAHFIRENFESAAHVAHVFGVDATTAENWWEGRNSPSGFAVAYAYECFPEQAARSLRGEP